MAFYAVMLQPSMRSTVLYHYTTEHAVEYVVVALFFWGLWDVVLKFLSFPRQLAALRQEWLPPRTAREPVENAAALLKSVRERPRWLQNSRVGRRLDLALSYLVERGAADDYRDYLQYLADQDEHTTDAHYTVLRFTVGITPILGLVGTVVHFGTALSGVSFEQMAEQLPMIVGEMGTAFNTTTIALATSISMMFSMFLCERVERRIVGSVNLLVDSELLHRFEVKDANVTPFLAAMQTANADSLQMLTGTLQQLIGVWTQTLDTVFQKFDQRQQQEGHAWQQALETLNGQHRTLDRERAEQFTQLLAALTHRQDGQLDQINGMLGRFDTIRDDCRGFVGVLQQIAQGEGKLADLQETLNANLQGIQQTQKLEEAFHVLTAAAHLVASRNRALGGREAA